MGDHLPDMFRLAGIADVRTYDDDETNERGNPDFWAAEIWAHVIDNVGPRVVASGHASHPPRTENYS
jgi:hypothetical protein